MKPHPSAHPHTCPPPLAPSIFCVVQEVRVATDMSAEEMRATLQRVLRAIN